MFPAARLETSLGNKKSHRRAAAESGKCCCGENDNLFFLLKWSPAEQWLLVLSAVGELKRWPPINFLGQQPLILPVTVAEDCGLVISCSRSPLPYSELTLFCPKASPQTVWGQVLVTYMVLIELDAISDQSNWILRKVQPEKFHRQAFFFFCSVVFLQGTLFSGVEGIVLFPMAIHKKIVPLSFGCWG